MYPTTSWEEKGIERGKLDMLMRLLTRKFKLIRDEEKEIIATLKVSELDELAEMLLDFADYEDLKRYLSPKN
ncbi:MAG: DUF4351 domain-containing protein [Deinococcales bacterium]